jgi:hypothetical protein
MTDKRFSANIFEKEEREIGPERNRAQEKH